MYKNYAVALGFKTAWRNLVRNKSFAFICISSITMGLAAVWLIALYVADEYSYDRNLPDAKQVYRIAQHAAWDGGKMDIAITSPPFAPALKAKFPEIEYATRLDLEGGGIIAVGNKILKANDIVFADANFFQVFKYDFLFGAPESALVKPQSIVITENLAKKLFGNAAKAFNQSIYFDSKLPNVITGILRDLPQNSHLQFSGVRSTEPSFYNDEWQNSYLYTYIRLARSASVQSLERKLAGFAKETVAKEMKAGTYKMELQPLLSIHLYSNLEYELSPNGSISRVYLFVAIGLIILLIALINYMNLSTARAATRIKEVGVRKVIGSNRGNLIKMFITESVLISFIAALFAACLVYTVLPFFNDIAGKQLSIERFGIYPTLPAMLIFILITGIISGSYPAYFLSGFKTIAALKGQLGNLQGNIMFRKSLIVFQFSITVVMLSASLIIYLQMQYASNKSLGFNKEQTLSFHLDDRNVRMQTAALKTQLLKSTLVEGVAAAGNPIGNNDLGEKTYSFEQNGAISSNRQKAEELIVDEDFLRTMDITLLAGRNFSSAMPTDKERSILINETLMRTLGWQQAIGKKMEFSKNKFSPPETRTVIGVIKDFNTYSLQHKIAPLVMMLPAEPKDGDNLYVKIARGKALQALAYIKEVYAQFDKTNTAEFHFLSDNFARQYAAEQKQGRLSMVFTILAVVIACFGLFGLATFTAKQRTKEIGIRKVLGASIASVTIMLSKDFVKLVCIAIVIAIPVGWIAMNKWLQDFAYRINIEGWVFLVAGALALLIALITVSYQAIKAAIVNPAKSLRTE